MFPNHPAAGLLDVAHIQTLLALSPPDAEALAGCMVASGAPGTASATSPPAADVRRRVSVKGSDTAGTNGAAAALGVLAARLLRICANNIHVYNRIPDTHDLL